MDKSSKTLDQSVLRALLSQIKATKPLTHAAKVLERSNLVQGTEKAEEH